MNKIVKKLASCKNTLNNKIIILCIKLKTYSLKIKVKTFYVVYINNRYIKSKTDVFILKEG